jgi:hypothetical protein
VNESALAFEDQYEEKIIDYATGWGQFVDLKFTTDLKELQDSKRELEHYKKKVDKLLASRDKTAAKGGEIDPKLEEKLERNQNKLEETTHEYNKHGKNLDGLVGDLVRRSWKVLCPLLLSLLKFDVSSSQERALIDADLYDVLNDLSAVAKEHGLDLEGSTKDPWRSFRSEWRVVASAKCDSSASEHKPDTPAPMKPTSDKPYMQEKPEAEDLKRMKAESERAYPVPHDSSSSDLHSATTAPAKLTQDSPAFEENPETEKLNFAEAASGEPANLDATWTEESEDDPPIVKIAESI